MTVPGEGQVDIARIEIFILYDSPEFDIEAQKVLSELESRPW
jgi:hypothetical protein